MVKFKYFERFKNYDENKYLYSYIIAKLKTKNIYTRYIWFIIIHLF